MAKAAAAKGSAGKSRLSESIMSPNAPLPPPVVSSTAVLSPTNATANAMSPTDVIAPMTARKPSIHVPSKLVSGGP